MAEAATDTAARLELRGITKSYPGVMANSDIALRINAGSIHAILGENGAGKSTLVKIIYGVVKADAGDIVWNGAPVNMSSPAEARRLGIGMVFQHFSLFPALSVLDNLVLTMPPRTPRRAIAGTARELAAQHGFEIELDRTVHSLSVGQQQRVEILRCLMQQPKLLIMDEPTSVLTPQAVAELFAMLRSLAASGCSIAYISHKLHEVRELCDAATVLRRGKVVASVDPRGETDASLARHMIGDIETSVRAASRISATTDRLQVQGLERPAASKYATGLTGINLALPGGRIIGLGGVAGNGQDELLEALSGEWLCDDADTIRIDGAPAGLSGPTARRELGLAYIPEERLGHGAVPQLSLAKNVLLTGKAQKFVQNGLIRFDMVTDCAQSCIAMFDVRSGEPSLPAQSLSGGNLQKFIVGREFLNEPGIIIAAQPTWGLDVGAATAVRSALIAMRDKGAAILLVSEDLDELFEICDSIMVIAGGRLSPVRSVSETTIEEVGQWMAGRLPLPQRNQTDMVTGNAPA